MGKSPKKINHRRLRTNALYMVLGLVVAIGVLAPVYWMFMTSVMSAKDLTATPVSLFSTNISFDRYISVFTDNNTSDPAYIFRIALKNSTIIAVIVTIVSLIFGTFASYAFARLNFRGRSGLMMGVLFTYMLPPVALVIPLYKVFSTLKLLDSRFGLIIIYLSFIFPFIIWSMQGFFSSISKSYEEAASIDGASRFQTLLYVFFPIARPGAIATGILAFLMSWDEFFYSLVFTSSISSKTIPVAIAEFNGKFTIDYGMISVAGIIGSLIPVLIAIIFQKYIVMGMSAGGVKE